MKKTGKTLKKWLTRGVIEQYNITCVRQSEEAECGYICKGGGNFCGVCLGLDRAISLINAYLSKTKLYFLILRKDLDFKMCIYDTLGCVDNLPLAIRKIFKEGNLKMATSNTKVGSDKIRIRLKAYDHVVLEPATGVGNHQGF